MKYSSIDPTITEEDDQAASANAAVRQSGSMSFGGAKREDKPRTPNDGGQVPTNLDTMYSTISANKKAYNYQNWWDVEHNQVK
jgi:hypothetical protein